MILGAPENGRLLAPCVIALHLATDCIGFDDQRFVTLIFEELHIVVDGGDRQQ
jgi:hypothetical protein